MTDEERGSRWFELRAQISSEIQAGINMRQKLDGRISKMEGIDTPGQLSKKLWEKTKHVGFVDPELATRAVERSYGRYWRKYSKQTAKRTAERAVVIDTQKCRAKSFGKTIVTTMIFTNKDRTTGRNNSKKCRIRERIINVGDEIKKSRLLLWWCQQQRI